MAKKVLIFYCKRIQNHTCVACAKCHKGASELAGDFGVHGEDVEIVGMTDCGDCPGLLMPRAVMVKGFVEKLIDNRVDAVHLGTCIKQAVEHGECPFDLDIMKMKLEDKLGIPVVVGTHNYV